MHSRRIYKDHTSRKYISDFLVPCVGKDLKESEIGRRLSFVTQQQTEKGSSSWESTYFKNSDPTIVRWPNWYRALPRLRDAGSNPVLTTRNPTLKIIHRRRSLERWLTAWKDKQHSQIVDRSNAPCVEAKEVYGS